MAVDSAESLITSMFFDPRRYDLAKVGRYKFNKKLMFRNPHRGPCACGRCGKPSYRRDSCRSGDKSDRELADIIQNSAVPFVWIERPEEERQHQSAF